MHKTSDFVKFTPSRDFKIEEDRWKIEEDRGKSRKLLGRSRKIEGSRRDRGRSRKIEEDRGEIEERLRKIEEITFSLVNRFWAVFVTLEFFGIFLGGWSVRMDCVLGPGLPLELTPPHPPPAVKFTKLGWHDCRTKLPRFKALFSCLAMFHRHFSQLCTPDFKSGKEKAHKHKQILPVTAQVGGGSPDRVARGLPTGGQGSKVYVLCAEPKEHKTFSPGREDR